MGPDTEAHALPPLREIIAQHELRAKKALGQNFLLDSNVTDKIARAAGDLSGHTVIEIGPGPGGLTRSLLKVSGADKVIAVEFDARAVRALEHLKQAYGPRIEIVQADALETDLTALAPGTKRAIVANLPYNIATPLLTGWLEQIRQDAGAFSSMILMFQKEVAERITAKPGVKAYGRLGILCQWLCETRRIYDIPPSAFTPPPKVTSSVVRFTPKEPQADWPEFRALEAVTAAAFGQRRKMIRSSLKDYTARLEALGINTELRAENLGVDVFLKLAAE